MLNKNYISFDDKWEGEYGNINDVDVNKINIENGNIEFTWSGSIENNASVLLKNLSWELSKPMLPATLKWNYQRNLQD